MNLDVLILNSGEWVLTDELAADPWYILIYRQRGNRRNELHLWLPRRDAARTGDCAFRRFWTTPSNRWCVEVPQDSSRPRTFATEGPVFRFTADDGQVLWAPHDGALGLADLAESDLKRLLYHAYDGSYTGE